jgi:hypothetical protein
MPALYRWFYGAVMRLWARDQMYCAWPVAAQTNEWNVSHGFVAPIVTQEALRPANVALFAGALAIPWAVAAKAIGSVASSSCR